jgi:uncharacterized C2H2 Zn-finger protein
MNVTRHKPSQKKATANRTSREVLPILVPSVKGESHDGVANFYFLKEGPVSRTGSNVRLLRNPDISEQAMRKVLGPEDYELLRATLDLKKARETNDSLLQERAYQKLMPHLGWASVNPKVFSYPGWANVHVPRLATLPMEEARLVLWFSGKTDGSPSPFIPAIYCPNLKTAIFCRAFLSLQTCPHCGIIFLPEKENVVYCRPAHGHAHRVARMRAKQRGKHAKK